MGFCTMPACYKPSARLAFANTAVAPFAEAAGDLGEHRSVARAALLMSRTVKPWN